MNRLLKGLVRGLIPCLCLGLLQAQTVDLQQVTQRVDRHYNGLTSLEANFTESYRGGGLARTESGTMWLKKPGKMLLAVRQSHQKALCYQWQDGLVLCSGRAAGTPCRHQAAR